MFSQAELPKAYSSVPQLAATAQLRELRLIPRATVAAARDECGMTALCHASRSGALDVVKYLLDEVQVDASIPGWGGVTALMFAAAGAHESTAQHLLSVVLASKSPGQLLAAQDDAGNTAVHYACKGGSLSVLQLLLGAEEGGSGEKIAAVNTQGRSALHVAINHGHMTLVAFLIKHLAEIDARDNRGWTPLVRNTSCPTLIHLLV